MKILRVSTDGSMSSVRTKQVCVNKMQQTFKIQICQQRKLVAGLLKSH